jgi:hypothetical protein
MRMPKTMVLALFSVLFQYCPLYGDFGNWFVAEKRVANTLDTSSKKLSYRFTCQEDMTLTAAALFCLESRQAPAYLITLQEDVKGLPSGIPLSSTSFIPQAARWSTLPMDPIPLLKGRVYHLVVEQDTLRGGGHPVGVIGPGHFASFLSTDVLNHLHPNDGSPDPNTDTLYCENGRWRALGQEPVYAVYGSGSQFQGDPYDDPGTRPVYKGTLQGQSLHFHCAYTGEALAFRVKKRGKPVFPLRYTILVNDYRAHKCSPLYSSVALTPDQAPSDFQWVTIGLPEQVKRLFRAECWYFVFQTEGGRPITGPSGCEDCYVLSDAGNSGGLPRAADLTFDGGPHLSREVYSTDNGDPFGWKDEFERDANVGVLGPPCNSTPPREFDPLPTPVPLESEPRYGP